MSKFPKCRKCKSYLNDDGSCPRCSFRPHKGIVPPGMQMDRTPLAASKDEVDVEDDYGEESNADSVAQERSAVDRNSTQAGRKYR